MTTHNIFIVDFNLDHDCFTSDEKIKLMLDYNNKQHKATTRYVKRYKLREKLITCICCKSTHTADYYRDHILMKKHLFNEANFIDKTQLK
jgi:hypothetical protein